MKKKRNQIVSIVISLSMILCLGGCGNANRPVNGTAENIEEELPDNMDASDVADMLESGMSVDEIVDRVEEIKEGEATTDKPAEATASPEPTATASPTPTATPEPTSTPSPSPESTPEPHVHQYTETIIKAPTCAESGEKQLVCQGCGDVKVEAIPATGGHNWEPIYQTIVHQSTGHVESVEKQIQVGTTETRHEYECKYCGYRTSTPEELADHRASFVPDINHAGAGSIVYDYPGEPVYETQIESIWVVDTPETTTQELVGYKCSVCGATK